MTSLLGVSCLLTVRTIRCDCCLLHQWSPPPARQPHYAVHDTGNTQDVIRGNRFPLISSALRAVQAHHTRCMLAADRRTPSRILQALAAASTRTRPQIGHTRPLILARDFYRRAEAPAALARVVRAPAQSADATSPLRVPLPRFAGRCWAWGRAAMSSSSATKNESVANARDERRWNRVRRHALRHVRFSHRPSRHRASWVG